MDSRSLVELPLAFPVEAQETVTLILHQPDEPDVNLDVRVLRVQAGDTLVMSTDMILTQDTANKISNSVEELFPGVRAMVLSNGLKLEGVLRG